MRNNDLRRCGEKVIRVLEEKDGRAFIVNCTRKAIPKWVSCEVLSDFELCTDDEVFGLLPDVETLNAQSRKTAYERYTMISGILPFITDKKQRCYVIDKLSEEKKISKQTIHDYLWRYLVYRNIAALSPRQKEVEKELSEDEKNIRWALNRYFYNKRKNTLNTVYTLMLKEKYCSVEGQLPEHYPSFYQFRYFYRKHRNMQNYYISRDGIKSYQRNHRPLLGDGIQEFAPVVGVGMLDATICDIYLVNDSGGIVGRPILTACVDAYSGLCCGYSLSWEGGVYSLRNLLISVIADKVKLCGKFGIEIAPEDWNCKALPATLVTDMGKEYVSDTFSQITDLGVTVVNLPPYRPELKGAVEKFFDVVQGLFKPHLKGKGVIEPDYQERGAHDYRKDACLTMTDFERIVLRCIVFYNSQRIIENYPFSEKMLSDGVKPYASDIWNYGLREAGANLIAVDDATLIFTLLPRTVGRFTRKGLMANGLRYKNEDYTERYLTGGTVTVAYNPENVSEVWLMENGAYIPFALIESRFDGLTISDVAEIKAGQKKAVRAAATDSLQAKISLADYIGTIAETAVKRGNADIKSIRDNRKREQMETHIDYIRGGVVNG